MKKCNSVSSVAGNQHEDPSRSYQKSNTTKTFTVYADQITDLATCRYYHLCSKGWDTDLLFHNREEFINGMNIVAVATHICHVEIMAFCLMNNHFHFILAEKLPQVSDFAKQVTMQYKARRRKLYPGNNIKIIWSAFAITDREYLLTSIAYVLTNPIRAGFDQWAGEYEWSSASILFRSGDHYRKIRENSQKIEMLKARKKEELLSTRHCLPDDWLVTREEYVWPGSYIGRMKIEQLYGSYKNYQYYLTSPKTRQLISEEMLQRRTRIPDTELHHAAIELCRQRFEGRTILNLDQRERLQLGNQLQEKFKCTTRQICKIVHLQYDG